MAAPVALSAAFVRMGLSAEAATTLADYDTIRTLLQVRVLSHVGFLLFASRD